MRLPRDKLIFRALVVIDEAVDASYAAPVVPGPGLRFAAMFLYALGKGDRRAFDDLWKELQDPKPWAHSPEQASYVRSTMARSCFYSIARSCGCPETPEFFNSVKRARRPRAERDRERMAELVRQGSVERMREEERKRAARECDLSG